MLPIVHPMEKTKTEVKRSVQRLELYVKSNPEDAKALSTLSLLKRIMELLK